MLSYWCRGRVTPGDRNPKMLNRIARKFDRTVERFAESYAPVILAVGILAALTIHAMLTESFRLI